jgi:hypothetical protein
MVISVWFVRESFGIALCVVRELFGSSRTTPEQFPNNSRRNHEKCAKKTRKRADAMFRIFQKNIFPSLGPHSDILLSGDPVFVLSTGVSGTGGLAATKKFSIRR